MIVTGRLKKVVPSFAAASSMSRSGFFVSLFALSFDKAEKYRDGDVVRDHSMHDVEL